MTDFELLEMCVVINRFKYSHSLSAKTCQTYFKYKKIKLFKCMFLFCWNRLSSTYKENLFLTKVFGLDDHQLSVSYLFWFCWKRKIWKVAKSCDRISLLKHKQLFIDGFKSLSHLKPVIICGSLRLVWGDIPVKTENIHFESEVWADFTALALQTLEALTWGTDKTGLSPNRPPSRLVSPTLLGYCC